MGNDESVSHDDTLTYAKTPFTGHLPRDGWAVLGENSTLAVTGSCPACHGPAYGPQLPMAETFLIEGKPDNQAEDVDVPVYCCCGFTHGKDGSSGCGRYWIVTVTVSI